MYCEPANCYCIDSTFRQGTNFLQNEMYYIRPEKVNISDKISKYSQVRQVFFSRERVQSQGKD